MTRKHQKLALKSLIAGGVLCALGFVANIGVLVSTYSKAGRCFGADAGAACDVTVERIVGRVAVVAICLGVGLLVLAVVLLLIGMYKKRQAMHQVSQRLAVLCGELHAWAAVVMVPDPQRTALVCAAHYNLPSDWAALTNALDDTSLNGRSFTHGVDVFKHGMHLDIAKGAQTQHHVEAVLVVPIRSGETVVGTLEIIADSPGVAFTNHERQTAEKAANEISVMLQPSVT